MKHLIFKVLTCMHLVSKTHKNMVKLLSCGKYPKDRTLMYPELFLTFEKSELQVQRCLSWILSTCSCKYYFS